MVFHFMFATHAGGVGTVLKLEIAQNAETNFKRYRMNRLG